MRLLLLVVAAVAACKDDEEAERVLGLIDRMRDVPLAERTPHIEALDRARPTHAGAARARATCLEAYKALQAAHDCVDAAKRRLDQSAGQPRYEDVVAVDEALSDMTRAKAGEPACVDAVADLRRELRR